MDTQQNVEQHEREMGRITNEHYEQAERQGFADRAKLEQQQRDEHERREAGITIDGELVDFSFVARFIEQREVVKGEIVYVNDPADDGPYERDAFIAACEASHGYPCGSYETFTAAEWAAEVAAASQD